MVPHKLIPIFTKYICCFGSQFTVGDLNTSCSFDHEYHSSFSPFNSLIGHSISIPLHNPAVFLDIKTSPNADVSAARWAGSPPFLFFSLFSSPSLLSLSV